MSNRSIRQDMENISQTYTRSRGAPVIHNSSMLYEKAHMIWKTGSNLFDVWKHIDHISRLFATAYMPDSHVTPETWDQMIQGYGDGDLDYITQIFPPEEWPSEISYLNLAALAHQLPEEEGIIKFDQIRDVARAILQKAQNLFKLSALIWENIKECGDPAQWDAQVAGCRNGEMEEIYKVFPKEEWPVGDNVPYPNVIELIKWSQKMEEQRRQSMRGIRNYMFS
ncbi:hypothetical protein BS50DRAFT_630785 [Corynespora cassiicola Philippines]|uniref:Uncharacterized protein n=1 Tax=Corynespora cassiicola Philippines TaxID=1448308 RepID=A0A2T2NZ57_CORCC|nr:hypothetical protein BS50DRAFT_630785 [Corynespora cassiicola Philippines]